MKSLIVNLLAALALAGGAGSAKPLKIYTEIGPPNQYIGSDGNLTGIAVEVVQEIQKRLNNRDPVEVIPWARAYQEVQADPNVVLFTMARTPERDPLFQWVGPISELNYNFYARADTKIAINDLQEARKLAGIGVYRDDVRDLFLTKLGFTNLYRTADNQTNLKMVMIRRLDVFTASDDGFDDLVKVGGFKPEQFKKVFSFLKIQLFIAFSKNTPKPTVQAWSDAFKAMQQDGTYRSIYKKYLPDRPLPKDNQ